MLWDVVFIVDNKVFAILVNGRCWKKYIGCTNYVSVLAFWPLVISPLLSLSKNWRQFLPQSRPAHAYWWQLSCLWRSLHCRQLPPTDQHLNCPRRGPENHQKDKKPILVPIPILRSFPHNVEILIGRLLGATYKWNSNLLELSEYRFCFWRFWFGKFQFSSL